MLQNVKKALANPEPSTHGTSRQLAHRNDMSGVRQRTEVVVVGYRPDGPLARWFSSVGTYLVKNLRCSMLVAQTEISGEEFAELLIG
jgi:hypothetical protein